VPGASLTSLAKRLICRECKSSSVRAYRRIDNDTPLSPHRPEGDVSPKRA